MAEDLQLVKREMAEDLEFVKREITFFMEKTFQVSFGYFGALIAFLAAFKLEIVQAAGQAIGTGGGVVIAWAVLLLDVIYLTVAGACIYAVLKRGYFILIRAAVADPLRAWEVFERAAEENPIRGDAVPGISWNVDNYYMAPIYILIVVISAVAAGYCLLVPNTLARAIMGVLVSLHIFPAGWTLVAAKRMDGLCRRHLALETPSGPVQTLDPRVDDHPR